MRPERPQDCAAVAAAHVAAWQAGYAHILPRDLLNGLDADTWAQRRRERLDQPAADEVTLVAETAGHLVGHVTFGRYRTPPDQDVGEIWACSSTPTTGAPARAAAC
ncbi:hypothetical protein ACFQX7_28020 [Luedemannella flava]